MDKTDPLAALVDIPLPAAITLWPRTWESQLLIALLAVGLIAGTWWLIRWRRANRYRRAALAELDAIGDADPGALAVLVRKTALAAFPREKVAAISGVEWLAFLDRSYGGTGFAQGPGRMLATGPYQPRPDPGARTALRDLVRRWIRTHHD